MGLLDDAIREHLDLKRSRGADPAEIERAEREALGPVRREPSSLALADQPGDAPHGVGTSVDSVDVLSPARPAKRRGLLRRSRGGDADLAGARDRASGDDHEPLVRVQPLQREAPPYESEPSTESEPEPLPHDHELLHDDELEAVGGAVDGLSGSEPEAGADRESELYDGTEPPRLRVQSPGDSGHQSSGDSVHQPGDSGQRAAPPEAAPPPVAAPGPTRLHADDPLGETAEYDVESAFAAEPGDGDVLEETPEFLQDTPDHDRLWFEQRPPRDFDFDG